MLILGGGLSYVLYVQLAKTYVLGPIEITLIAIPALIAVAFAFIKFKGLSLLQLILLLIEQLLFRPMQRHWVQGAGDAFTSSTMSLQESKKKAIVEPEEKNYSEAKVKALAAVLDGEKSPKPANNTQ